MAEYIDNEGIMDLIAAYGRRWEAYFQKNGIKVNQDDIGGTIGFAIARSIRGFDPNRGVKFTSYCIQAINFEMGKLRNKVIKYSRIGILDADTFF
jgi:DNA-directed RNA polymerase specialized sigma subunit